MGQAFATASGGQGGFAQLAALGRIVTAQDDVQRADHHGQQVVEVVRHPAGQPSDRLHPLGVHQLGLGLGLFDQGFVDPLFQQFVDPLQIVLGPFGVGDVQTGPT